MRLFSNAKRKSAKASSAGFSILEMLIACGILMFGVVSVVQLIPTSLQTNVNNRLDTMATVIAQRELDQMLSQPVTVNNFVDKDGNAVSLGGAGSAGSALIMDGTTAVIDFSQTQVPGYSIPQYIDPNDPTGTVFELRWTVISETSGGTVISKRIIVGCRRTNANQLLLPVNLDSWVQRF
jgi:type II secretory pathway pseudopilin PulG